ncbi:uncharacterized protein LOC123665395 [Melitaea cinxia]|uniref:uncharacterized protein LOC123665395 n=1 Tax=Melitaea cinxia TaxID=113334 RepID=UPI001E26FE67|nr:uncharacterized protein LOC123665395 [Melitaea cinxia]
MGCHIEEDLDYVFCYMGETKGLYGVGFLIKKAWKNNITNFTGISERVALLQMKFGTLNISIIQAYAPTERSDDTEIQKFYNDLKIAHTLADEKIIILGDFNAKIGQPKKEEKPVMGQYGLGRRNERGERLLEYAFEYRLAIINTYFKKRPSRRWTWKSPDESVKNEIDYIMTNVPKIVQNYEVLNNVKFRTDHRLIRATVLLNQPKKSRKGFKPAPKIPKTEEEIRYYIDNLKLNIENKLVDTRNVQSYYDALELTITKSLTNQNDTKKEKRHKILSEETIALIKKRYELTISKNKDTNTKKELSKLYKETSKAIKRDYSKHRQKIITENLNKSRSTRKAFKELNLKKTWIQKLEGQHKETKTRQEIIQQATTFYRELYKNKDTNIEKANESQYCYNTETIRPIEEKDIYAQLKQLKSDKSPGPDGVTNEVLKIGAPVLIRPLTKLFNLILEAEIVPIQCISKVMLESTGDAINIKRGVRQGDPLSPKLFIAVLEDVFQNTDWETRGIKINNSYLSHLRFADDIVILSETANELQDMLRSLAQASSKVGLEMNATKTKIMTNSIERPINVREKSIEYVHSYIYLGKQISFLKTRNEDEIERRANIAWKKFWSLKEILKGDYSINLKKVVLDTCILPCLLYGCQTWIYTTKAKQRITTTQRAMERSILNIRKVQKVRSKVIRQKTKITDALTQALKLKWQWAGHVSRYTDSRWTIITTRWKGPIGKRRVGRPKRQWADDITQLLGKDWPTISRDRDEWKGLEEAFTRGGVHIQ